MPALDGIEVGMDPKACLDVCSTPLEAAESLLAMLFQACEPQSLLRLEAALGARLGRELRKNSTENCLNWMRLLREECGLTVACAERLSSTCSNSSVSRCTRKALPPVQVLKSAVRSARVSTGLTGGWRRLRLADDPACGGDELLMRAAALAALDARLPDGRVIRDRHSTPRGSAQRLALLHFDVPHGFVDGSWKAIMSSFQLNRPLPAGAQRSVSSAPVSCRIEDATVPLSLTLSSILPELVGPEGGCFMGLDLKGFEPYIQDPQRRHHFLHISCSIYCGELERKAHYVLFAQPSRGLRGQRADTTSKKHLWQFAPLQNLGLALSVEVAEGSSDGRDLEEGTRYIIDEEVQNASWNSSFSEGTGLVPLVWMPDNEFAAHPIAPGLLQGAIALVRRGGDCGFAQKAIAARDAGAVGCIIYESDGDRETWGEVSAMGQRFGGVNYPDPGIPTVMINATEGQRLLRLVKAAAANSSPAGAPRWVHVRIGLSRADEELRRPPTSFQKFCELAIRGTPVRVAMLIEKLVHEPLAMQSQDESSLRNVLEQLSLSDENMLPDVTWFEGTPSRPVDKDNESWVEIGTVHVNLN